MCNRTLVCLCCVCVGECKCVCACVCVYVYACVSCAWARVCGCMRHLVCLYVRPLLYLHTHLRKCFAVAFGKLTLVSGSPPFSTLRAEQCYFSHFVGVLLRLFLCQCS